jgi:hypothetical protein
VAAPPKSVDRNVIKRRSIESVSAAIFSNPGEAKKRPCKTHGRCIASSSAAQPKPESAEASGSSCPAAADKFQFARPYRRGGKKYKRRFFSQVRHSKVGK